ncbi:MAG: histidine phosphatase family protein [Vulcanimicrobiaceae bacterium]
MPASVWIARHGETTWNLAGRYQGRLESALSARGVRQGFALADAFAAKLARGDAVPTRIVSSPLLRCHATARFTASRLGADIETDDRLIEIAHGTWEGRYRDELAANDPLRYRTWREDPAHATFDGGESLVDVLERWRAFARDLATRDEPTLVLTHDAVVRCALVDLQRRPLDEFWQTHVENAAYARLERTSGTLVLVEECVSDHLGALRADVATQAL